MLRNAQGANCTARKTLPFAAPFALMVALVVALFAAPTTARAFELFGIDLFGAGDTQSQEGAVADESTIDTWQGYTKTNSTENVGRIWTDKTVQTGDITLTGGTQNGIKVTKEQDADFLVGLSALSSTSNLTTASSKPLDIVILFDASGSMDDRIGGRQSQTKMEALKDAVESFVNSMDVENGKISDAGMKHRISLVKFADDSSRDEIGNDVDWWQGYNYTQVVSEFSYDATALKKSMAAIEAGGATAADYGLRQASRVIDGDQRYGLNGARENAQKVIIFFTDGEPNHSSGFSTNVANEAIKSAKELKSEDVLIYSVGVVNNANPDANIDVNNDESINAYLHSVSSNYPDATGWVDGESWWDRGEWEMGVRADDTEGDKSYYKAATDAEGLNSVFEKIFDEIKTPGSSPTEVEEGFGGANGGYITFTDKLGDYMTVKGDTMTVVFANEIFYGTRQSNGTFKFTGKAEGNPVYPDADMSHLLVTVEPGQNGAGDTVTVKIPAELIPLRNYSVTTENGETTMDTAEAYPIRIFYSVGLQEGTEALVANPDAAMKRYLEENMAEDSTVSFYSNDFTKGSETGATTAAFTPASTNKFYYFNEDTPLYKDENFAQHATVEEIQKATIDTVYYKNAYYEESGATGVPKTESISIPVSTLNSIHRGNWQGDEQGGRAGNAYMKKGTPRLNRTNDFDKPKEQNATGTAGKFISPAWNEGQNGIIVSLGNNGKKSMDVPATLTVTKRVDAADGFTASDYQGEDTKFTFNIEVEGANGNYDAVVMNSAHEVQGEAFELNFENGVATHALKHDDTLYIYGLPAGASYTVTEVVKDGFTTQKTDDTGTLAANGISSAEFTNTYEAEEATLAEDAIKVKKSFEGRDWREGESFTFTISNGASDAPMPDKDTVTISKDTAEHTASFGKITYNKPGEYRYVITEDSGNIIGVDYSSAEYRVIVTVTDNGDGTMTAKAQMAMTSDDTGMSVGTGDEGKPVESGIATFTNTYNIDALGTATIRATKNYDDMSGDNGWATNKFTFQLKALGGFVTGSDSENLTIDASETPMPEGAQNNVVTTGNSVSSVTFPEISFGSANVGNTYVYEVTELDSGEEEMDYDTDTSYRVKVVVTEEMDGSGEDAHIVPTVIYPEDGVVFNNTYRPIPAKLSGDTAISGTKTLIGRDAKEGEEFSFTLKPTGSTLKAIEDGAVTGIKADGLTATVSGAKNGVASAFSFGTDEKPISFTKVGSYTFEMKEDAPAGNGDGMEYDRHPCTVTVDVSLDKTEGKLDAAVSYGSEGASAFENVYTASTEAGVAALNVSKTLNGRAMSTGEFGFTITGTASDSVSAEDATAKLTTADKSFKNEGAAEGVAWTARKLSTLMFNQDDAGKTYSYVVDEVEPAEGKLAAVTYDQSQFRVDIAVTDDGDGTMSTATTITRMLSATGEALAEPADAVAFVNAYAPASAALDGESVLAVTKKVTGAPTSDTFNFTLQLTGGGAANVSGLGEDGKLTASTTGAFEDGGTERVVFGVDAPLTFTKPGVYTFTVAESTPAKKTGWTWDTDSRTITVNVTDKDVDGSYLDQLVATVSGNNQTITNHYQADPVTLTGDTALTVEKTVTGLATDADFNFTLAPVEEDGVDWDSVQMADGFNETVTIDGGFSAGESKTVAWGDITFSKAGTYKFKVVEDEAHDETVDPTGWTYDKSEQVITVEVTDKGFDGQLDAVVSGPAQFTNRYGASSVTLEGETALAVKKTLEGRPWLEGEEYGFTLSAVGDAPMPDDEAGKTVTATKGGATVKFGSITFDVAGEYQYAITENAPEKDGNGITYDRHTAAVIVTVTDNQQGKLEASVSYDNADALSKTDAADTTIAAFTNYYTAAPVTYGGGEVLLGGHKYLQDETGGFKMKDGDFTFYMRAQSKENPMPDGLENTPDEEGRGTVNVQNSQTNSEGTQAVYDFGTTTFKMEDLRGGNVTDNGDGTLTKKFRYNIWEADTELPGIRKDNDRYTVTFTVTEDLKTGTMSVKAEAVMLVGGSEANQQQAGIGELDFTNIHKAGEKTSWQNILKTLDGRDFQAGDQFTFNVEMTAVDEDGQPMHRDKLPTVDEAVEGEATSAELSELTYTEAGDGFSYTATIKPTKTETGNTYVANTGTITYRHTGTYTWKVGESAEPKIAGVTNDETVYTLVVKITKDGEDLAREVVSVTPEPAAGNTLPFTNRYQAGSVTLDGESALAVQKTLTGRDWLESDEFTFTLAAETEGAPMPGDATVSVKSAGVKDGDAVKAAFGSIKFDKAGTYTYAVTETVPAEDGKGITRDGHTSKVTVEVTDNTATGKLEAKVSYDNGDALTNADKAVDNAAAFTNTYKAGSTTLSGAENLKVTKMLSGRDWEAGDSFEFTLAAGDDATAKAVKAGDVKLPNPATLTINSETEGHIASFGDITFSKAGDYAFKITETAGKLPGVHYDTTDHVVKVKVTEDQAAGTLTAAVTEGANPTITNTYNATETTGAIADFDITKRFTGKPWDGESFEFTLAPVSAAAADGSEIVEVPMPAEGGETATVSAPDEKGGDTAAVKFGDITYAQAGTYVYEVTETNGGKTLNGITYDNRTATVTVTVTDKADDAEGASTGQLVATATVENGTFENTYHAAIDYAAVGGLGLTKTLNGRDMIDGQFEFTVKAEGEDPLGIDGKAFTSPAADAGVKSAVVNLLAGTEGAEFTTEDDGDAYTYTITETNAGGEGYTYADPQTVTIAVADNGDGTITVTTTIGEDVYTYTSGQEDAEPAVVDFVNSYDSGDVVLGGEGDAVIEATKTLTGRPMVAGEFGFAVKDANGVEVATGENAAADDGVAGAVTFSAISYDFEKLEGDVAAKAASKKVEGEVVTYTYQYTVEEVSGAVNGVAGVDTKFTVAVTVTDANDGKLTVDVAYPENSDGVLAFTNTYGADEVAKTVLKGTKVIEGNGLPNAPTLADVAGAYTFELTASEGAPLPERTSATNDATGTIDFGAIEFTMENVFGGAADAADAETLSASRSETFTYTITESGKVDGITNDAEDKSIKVTVTDNGDGTISVDPEGLSFTFTNSYSVTPVTFDPTGEGGIQVTKTLTGRDMAEGEFTFGLFEGDATEPIATGTASAAADGEAASVDFGTITYTEPGEYIYTLRELAGDKGGVDYDTAAYTVRVSVADMGDGTLGVTTDFEGEAAFENTYTAASTTVGLTAAKRLTGAELTDGQFTFQMLDKDGKVFREVKNAADGAVVFPEIEFTKAGTYSYSVVEVDDGQEGVTYDDAVFELRVEVVDNGQGQLEATVVSDAEQYVFENAYKKPENPVMPKPGESGGNSEDALPKTGDDTLLAVGGVGAAAVVLIGAGLVLHRRKQR